jgi:excisionase family DNA binding protein
VSKQKEAMPAIGDRLLTLQEAAEVLRLSTRTVREYVKRSEINGRIIGKRWRLSVQTLTLSLKMRPLAGILLERATTGIRWWPT